MGPKKGFLLELAMMSEIPMRRRQTMRSLSAAIGVTKSTLHRMLKREEIKRVSNRLKPLLTPENETQRVQFVMDQISAENGEFINLTKKVHVDEKNVLHTYYLLPNEEPPERSAKSKRFITKVMFLAAVAQPCFNDAGDCVFNGRIGIWPFVEEAKRNSKNRPKGTLETKRVKVTKIKYYKMLEEKLIPAIREKWISGQQVQIQHDNARPHGIDLNDMNLTSSDGWDIQLINQPPNSPDFNVLDLGFFASIQSLQQQEKMVKIDDLISAVEKSFWGQSVEVLDNVWVTYQKVMECALLAGGTNKYTLPHMGKARLRRQNQFKRILKVQDEAIDIGFEKLRPF